jgi:rare lipoprotein A (peptidoglycan hydrolase)
MSGSRRRSRANIGPVGALLLAVTVVGGCGDAQVGSPAGGRSSHTADPLATAPVGEGRVKALSTSTSATDASTGPKRPQPIPPAHPVPAAFRPAAGAPSDAEVRSELAQLDALQRRQREQQLSAAAANLAGLLPWSLEPRSGVQVSVASVFRDYGLGLACGGLLGRDQLGVAHKTAPCGTLITFTYGGRSITVPVIDRGPYIVGREWDLTGATAAALAFPGLGQIAWSVAG